MTNTEAVPASIGHPTTETRERIRHMYFDDVSFRRGTAGQKQPNYIGRRQDAVWADK